jgi:alpha-1,3-mannosylglycoprotein beta-1,4-N-acetylglucosaminyltransferase A/B
LYCGSADYYPDWLNNGTGKTDQLVPTFSDPMDRMIWRTRQSLDYMYLWSIATQKAKYFLQLEDDVTAVSKFLNFIDLQVIGISK